jgi:hypothetical protein
MKRLLVALLFGLVALPAAGRADEPVGCALTSAAPEGSVAIGCMGGVTEAFGG